MYKLRIFTCWSLLILATHVHAAVFGPDTRELVTPTSPYAELGRATAVGVLNTLSTPDDHGHISLMLDPISSVLCRDERFSIQSSLQYACSAFLVGPDLLVTAGHCVTNGGETSHMTGDYCEVYNWLFDYQAHGASNTAQSRGIDADKLYKCKEIIYAVREDKPPFRDYALIRLDRPVLGRTPFKIAELPPVGGEVAMIGYPLGMPQVYSGKGKVMIDDPAHTAIVTNLNAIDGNSGSVVFNSKHEAVGILISGTPTEWQVPDVKKKCSRYNHCDADGTKCDVMDEHPETLPNFQHVGSDVERLGPIAELIKANTAH